MKGQYPWDLSAGCAGVCLHRVHVPFVPVFQGVLSDREGLGRPEEGVEHSHPTALAPAPCSDPTAVPVLFAQEPPAAVLVLAGKGQLCSMGAKALNSFQKHLLDVEQSGGFIQVSDLSTNIYTADKPKTWSGRGTAACSAVPSTEGILSGL